MTWRRGHPTGVPITFGVGPTQNAYNILDHIVDNYRPILDHLEAPGPPLGHGANERVDASHEASNRGQADGQRDGGQQRLDQRHQR